MSSTRRPQAIAGVSAGRPAVIATVYPSIASTGLGRLMGSLFDCMPTRVLGIKLSHWLILMPLLPLWATLAAVVFFWLKATGDVYVLTNRHVQRRSSLGNLLRREVPLGDIEQVVVRQLGGQQFYPAADIFLLSKSGGTLMSLPGVPRADVFRQSILEARDARRLVEASLSTILSRQPASA